MDKNMNLLRTVFDILTDQDLEIDDRVEYAVEILQGSIIHKCPLNGDMFDCGSCFYASDYIYNPETRECVMRTKKADIRYLQFIDKNK